MLKHKHLYLLIIICWASFSRVIAGGSNTFEGVKKVYLNSMGQIAEDGIVKGYYCFYFEDKADRKNNNYALNLLDADGRQVKTINITLLNSIHLVEAAYNGEAFLFEFYDVSHKNLQYMSYSKDGKLLGKRTLEKMKMWEIAAMQSKLSSENEDNNAEKAIFSAGKDGFIRYGYEKEKMLDTEIEYMDNNLKVKWTWKSDINNKLFEYGSYAAANSNYLTSVIMVKTGMMSKDFTNELLCLDMKTGKSVYRVPMQDKGKYFNCSFFDMRDSSEKVIMAGEYFNDAKFLKDESEGLFVASVGLDGKFTNSKLLSWATDVNKKVAAADKAKYEAKARIFFHRAVKLNDGSIYIIGEQYKKVASGMGIASRVLNGGGGGMSAVKVQLQNLIIFELSADLNLEK